MPEYLAPGVHLDETSFSAKSIEGVTTTTTWFVGPTRYGPTDLEPHIIKSLVEFERTYGDRSQLEFDSLNLMHNYMWHAVRAFFEEGGRYLYISRVFAPTNPNDQDSGHARGSFGSGAAQAQFKARWPGKCGNTKVRLTLRLGENISSLKVGATVPTMNGLRDRDVLMIGDPREGLASPPVQSFYVAVAKPDPLTNTVSWQFEDHGVEVREDTDLLIGGASRPQAVHVVTLSVTTTQPDGTVAVWDGLALDPQHKAGGTFDAFSRRFSRDPDNDKDNDNDDRNLPFLVEIDDALDTGRKILVDLFLAAKPSIEDALIDSAPRPGHVPISSIADRSIDVELANGDDGALPNVADYEGQYNDRTRRKTGLMALEDLEDISMVAAPFTTFGQGSNSAAANRAQAINLALISHAERTHYRIAVLDSGDGLSISAVRANRAMLDSKYAALYYPWVKVIDPVTKGEIVLPPSGFVCGIYARNDIERGVYKAPANEVVRSAIGFELTLNKAQQNVLNPEGTNCFRFFEGRGNRLWGARTISSDPEWKYVNVRRYFAYLERSIDKGTQWAVFEPNSEKLWANVRRTIEDFLFNEWQNGALLGDKPENAYFVKCDRSTMSQNDLDNGRLVCLIGVAPLRPAEFVIFRIGQWTTDRKI